MFNKVVMGKKKNLYNVDFLPVTVTGMGNVTKHAPLSPAPRGHFVISGFSGCECNYL